MASRRNRIKGIANIPQRRKAIEEESSKPISLNEVGCDKENSSQPTSGKLTEINILSANKDPKLEEIELSNELIHSDKNLSNTLQTEPSIQVNSKSVSTERESSNVLDGNNAKPLIRRKFIKPLINISKKIKIDVHSSITTVENNDSTTDKEAHHNNYNEGNISNINYVNENHPQLVTVNSNKELEITLNEIKFNTTPSKITPYITGK